MALALLIFCSALAFLASASAAQNGGGAGVEMELWCVAKNNAPDAALQTALDWACGQGGSNCSPIQQGGPCYDASDIQKTASFAFNDYFLKHGQTDDSCNFNNNAALTSLNPSYGSCKFPSSKTAGNVNLNGGSVDGGGLGPSLEDVNSSSSVSKGWMWSFLLISHLLLSLMDNL